MLYYSFFNCFWSIANLIKSKLPFTSQNNNRETGQGHIYWKSQKELHSKSSNNTASIWMVVKTNRLMFAELVMLLTFK